MNLANLLEARSVPVASPFGTRLLVADVQLIAKAAVVLVASGKGIFN